jgi:Fe(3+) dicitrate transport protein
LPGAGINYIVHKNLSVFAGVHRGFAPPRTKDAISSEGFAYDLEQEISTNYELGARWRSGRIQVAPTLFLLDFKNQVIPTSQSSGNLNETGLTNGGRTRHAGIEAEVTWDVLKPTTDGRMLQLGMNATWVNSHYAGDRFLPEADTLINVNGNDLPYAPALLLNHFLIVQFPSGPGLRIAGNYVSAQYTDELNTEAPTADGLVGLIPSRYVMDASAWYTFRNEPLTLSIAVKNMLDERYIASRRPQGIKVGLPRFITAGIDWKF